jgi:hypothetical protein
VRIGVPIHELPRKLGTSVSKLMGISVRLRTAEKSPITSSVLKTLLLGTQVNRGARKPQEPKNTIGTKKNDMKRVMPKTVA